MPKYACCNLCGKDNTELVERAQEPYSVVKCSQCGLVYVNPRPSIEDLSTCYLEDYYSEWIKEQRKRRLSIWKKRLKEIKKFKKAGNLLDIGSGTGLFLNIAKNDGWQVQGTEFSKYAREYAKKQFNLDIFKGELNGVDFKDNFFDVITMWHVLEHMQDPLMALKAANRVLKRDGLLVIAVPNFNNYFFKLMYFLKKGRRLPLFEKNIRDVHLYHFTPVTIKQMLNKAGFRIRKITVDTGRAYFIERVIDNIALFVYKIFRIHFGTLKIYAGKR